MAYASLLAVLLGTARPVAAVIEDPRPPVVSASELAQASPVSPAGESLAHQVEALRVELGELRAGLRDAPPWAVQMRDQLDQRIERMAEMQERLAARIETPAPRLDEPIVLFTVASCTLLFGFVVGRGVQRRSTRRDLRLRL